MNLKKYMHTQKTNKLYDLENRTFLFAKDVRVFIKKLPRTICDIEDCKQLARSSGSVGANYIEANESLSTKDFYYRIKICRKEAKETVYWLKLIEHKNVTLESEQKRLINESIELTKIFGSIVSKNNLS